MIISAMRPHIPHHGALGASLWRDWVRHLKCDTTCTRGVSQRYLRNTIRKQGKMDPIPPSAIPSRKGIARYRGLSHIGMLRAWPEIPIRLKRSRKAGCQQSLEKSKTPLPLNRPRKSRNITESPPPKAGKIDFPKSIIVILWFRSQLCGPSNPSDFFRPQFRSCNKLSVIFPYFRRGGGGVREGDFVVFVVLREFPWVPWACEGQVEFQLEKSKTSPKGHFRDLVLGGPGSQTTVFQSGGPRHCCSRRPTDCWGDLLQTGVP